ncbi:MAG TPA: outer membrane beta-barrel protein, partial [Terriglobales bacterium]
ADNRTGYRVSLGFGDAINTVNLVDSTTDGGSTRSFFGQYLEEAYFSYLAPVGNGLQFDFGKYVTPHGAEVIETKDNLNYTRGLLFTWAIPFYHFGARAKYTINDKAAMSFFVANGWNNVIDNNSGKTYGVSLALNPSSKFSIVQAYMAGPEQANDNDSWRHLADTVVTISPTSKLSFIVNFDYGHDRVTGGGPDVYWTGVAGYVKYAPSAKYALVGRYEYFDDHDGFMTGTPQAMKEFTGTFQRAIAGNIIARLEYRHDYSNQPVFVKGINPVFGQDTLTAGLVFTFDSREAK